MSAELIEDLRRNAGYAGNPKGLLLEAADALASKEEEIKRLRKIACLARDVSLAATQDDAGRWIINGDAEMMLGELYTAVEAPEIRSTLQGDADVSRGGGDG